MMFKHTCVGMRTPDPYLGSFKTFEGPIVMCTCGGSEGRFDMPLLEPTPPPVWFLDKWRLHLMSSCIVISANLSSPSVRMRDKDVVETWEGLTILCCQPLANSVPGCEAQLLSL